MAEEEEIIDITCMYENVDPDRYGECSEELMEYYRCAQCKKAGPICDEHAKECSHCKSELCGPCYVSRGLKCKFADPNTYEPCGRTICELQYCNDAWSCFDCGETICPDHQVFCEGCNLHQLCYECWEQEHSEHTVCNKYRGTQFRCKEIGKNGCEYKHRNHFFCRNSMCIEHSEKCTFCNAVICDKHTCNHCDKAVCYAHRKICCKTPDKKRKREGKEEPKEAPPKKIIDLTDL